MNTKTENLIPVQFSGSKTKPPRGRPSGPLTRRLFVEPAVSFPIDVLEATTFFQLTDSGSTT